MDIEAASARAFRTRPSGLGVAPRQGFLVVLSIFAFLSLTAFCHARVTCIRLGCNHMADTTDLKRFRDFHLWKDKPQNERAIAIWKYLSDYETGLYHFNEILEGPDPFDEYATVRDALKILNVYNMGYCGIFGPVLDGIYQGVGFTGGRSFGLEAWNHCATEVWYGEGWHYLDVDVRGALLRPDGIVASLAEAQGNRSLWVEPVGSIEPFFPNDRDKARLFDIYKNSRVHYYYRWFEGSHTMDFYLRQGESFTRWWAGQGGRWHHLPRYAKTRWVRDLIEQEPRGTKPNHRHFTRWNHGNGLFEYMPKLTKGFTDFEDGYYDVKNLRPADKGLEIIRTGQAEVTFEVFTPYIIVPKVGDIDDASDDAEASMVIVEGPLAVEVCVSLDHGLSWRPAARTVPGRQAVVDLTHTVKGTYGYLVKLTTSGPAGSTAIDSLNIRTWVQVAPISLPLLKEGKTTFEYRIGDRYGQRTIPMLINPDTAEPEDLSTYVLGLPDDYDPGRHTCRIRGEVVLNLAAPPAAKIAWLSVGGTFRTHQGEQARDTDNRIAYAVGRPEDFRQIHQSNVPGWVNHWRYNWDTDVVFSDPAEKVYVKYTANTGLNTIRACLHLLEDREPDTNIRVVHTYRLDGQLKTTERYLTSPAKYDIECAGAPENVSVKMEVPHGKR
ncbi:MAG: hypothetical protein JSU94_15225 [Phycisphaerales bacterium]|nr:MAG: hypothetical protein JSU94_15225 [Phycisphaerales bacterium]